MKKTFVDVMLELPVDATLRDFLAGHGLSMPESDSCDAADANQTLVEVVTAWADTDARDRMVANFMASVSLGDEAGRQALFEAAMADPAAVTGLALCQSDLQRSFWLYTHHPTLFERASDFDFWAHHGTQAQQYDL